MKNFIFLIFFCFIFFNAFSQSPWSLEACIEKAITSNLNIKEQELNSKIVNYSAKQSQLSLLPTLNIYSSQVHNFGRAIDPFTNDFTIENVRSNNLSLSSSITIFNGFQKINTIKKNILDHQASKLDVEKTINDVSLSVANAFLQVLFAKELLEVAQQQLEVSNLQVQRIEKMVEFGTLARGTLLEVQSQKISEELQLINAQNQLESAYLNIKQLLEIKKDIDFEILIPDILIPETIEFSSSEEIFRVALKNFPEVRSAELRFQGSKKDLAISKGNRSPIISLNTSIGTGYSDARIDLLTGNKTPFDIQIEDNFSQSITISLSIPILNEWQVSTLVQQSKIGVLQAMNRLQQTKNQLQKQTDQAKADVLAAQKQYSFAKKSAESFKESFRYLKQKYDLGIINTYEYHDGKIKLNKAESELVRAKYDYLFKIKIIDFYMGKKLTL